MSYTAEKLRNVVLMGHADSGKTSLLEAMLHATGAVGRLGSIQAGTTVSDYDSEEKAKQHSVQLAVAHVTHDGHELNLIDTPGYPDFFSDAHCGVAAADIALIVIHAKNGLGLNSRQAWKLATEHGLAKMIVINKVDSDNVDLDALVASIQASWGSGCVWFSSPAGVGAAYSANTDAMADPALREAIVEGAVETDEALMERYLEEGEISPEELSRGIANGIREGVLVPIIATSATNEVGVTEVLDALVKYFPSPLQAKPRLDLAGQPVDPQGEFLAHVFKVIIGDFGAQNYIRVVSGSTEGHTTLTDLNTEREERVGDFQRPQGKTLEPVGELVTGDIVIVPKVEGFSVGDTLSDGKATTVLPPIRGPQPMVKLAVTPRTRADETKLRPALDRLEKEDLSFRTERNNETNELIIKGLSMLHLETLLRRMKERTKVEVETHLPRIAYRETIRGKSEARYRHKKQTGGSGEFGEVALRLMPAERGEGFSFGSKIVGGAISQSYLPAIEKGIQEAMGEGVVAGYTFVDCRVEVFDGKEHPVDSKEVAFKKAGRGAFKEAVDQAKPVLLEPIMEVLITVPDGFTGDIMSDLARRRSQPQGMDQSEEGTQIKALVPEVEMQRYSQDLRSMTSGEGIYSMMFHHYEFLPPEKAQDLIDAHQTQDDPKASGRSAKHSGRAPKHSGRAAKAK